MEFSVRFMLNVCWKIHFSGWVSVPYFGTPWNPVLVVRWSKSDVISNVRIITRPRRVLMASGTSQSCSQERGNVFGMVLVLLSECDPIQPGNAEPGVPAWESFWQPHGWHSSFRKRFWGAERPWPILVPPSRWPLLGRLLVGSAWKYRHWKRIFLLSFPLKPD